MKYENAKGSAHGKKTLYDASKSPPLMMQMSGKTKSKTDLNKLNVKLNEANFSTICCWIVFFNV